MDNLRRRVPFTISESAEDHEEALILDEQEQEAIIESLRKENVESNQQYLLFAYVLLGLSTFLQVISFFGSSERNPILNVFPTNQTGGISIPLSRVFTLVSLIIHFDLLRSIYPDEQGSTTLLDVSVPTTPIYISYCITTIPTILSLSLSCPWQTTTWWSVPIVMTFLTHFVKESIRQGRSLLSELESKKYVAPGA
ncbi:hypothetical protein BDN72DRAFT_846410 [Pluteus cervinus]|uniref:Uncharacterized protein n=1 Tax=Pluteus cervinus TaxID=181527 RepID=A0ACD3AFH4_9AGAR|nr:hypothetical protein BDN72DRAFT_846410 [Pluteus cervinus]